MTFVLLLIVWIALILISRGIAKNRNVDVSTATWLAVLFGIFGIAYALIATPKQTQKEFKEDKIDQRIQRFEKLKTLKDEGLITDDEFNSEKSELKKVIESPKDYEYITIKHIQGKPEVVTRDNWEKLQSKYGSANYVVLSYH